MATRGIGLTMRTVENEAYPEKRDVISHDWIALLERCGFLPILMPNLLEDIPSYVKKMGMSAIVLTGGNSLGESTIRDSFEKRLLRYAIDRRMPVVGICRGMQLINVYFGGSLIQLESSQHVAKLHKVDIVEGLWRDMFGNDLNVNSFHNYGISQKTLAKGLIPAAYSIRRLVEAFYHCDLPIVGTMWHPERRHGKGKAFQKIIRRLTDEGKFW